MVRFQAFQLGRELSFLRISPTERRGHLNRKLTGEASVAVPQLVSGERVSFWVLWHLSLWVSTHLQLADSCAVRRSQHHDPKVTDALPATPVADSTTLPDRPSVPTSQTNTLH